MYRSTKDDAIYEWEIEPFEHITEQFLVGPEAQFGGLNDGFWQVVMYPRKMVKDKEYVQCGLRKVPVHTGPQDTTVRFRFELTIDGVTVPPVLGPRRGEYPKDNDVGYSVVLREDIFRDRRSINPIKLTVTCHIRNLSREKHPRNFTLTARTEIVAQKVVEMLEVQKDARYTTKQIVVGRAQKQDGFQPLSVGAIEVSIEDNSDWMKIAIVSSANSHPSAINCVVSVLDSRGQVFSKTQRTTHFFLVDGDEWVLPSLITRETLDNPHNNLLDANQRYLLHFDMQISVGEIIHHQDKTPTSRQHLPGCGTTLAEALGKAFESKKSSDLAVVVDEEHAEPGQEPIKVHKCILASRSEVFKRMLEGDMKEKHSDQIPLSGMDYYTLESLMRFLYTDELDFVDKETGLDLDYLAVVEIYKAANMYMVPMLTMDCSNFLQVHITKENARFLKDLAALYSDRPLADAVAQFVANSGEASGSAEQPLEPAEAPTAVHKQEAEASRRRSTRNIRGRINLNRS